MTFVHIFICPRGHSRQSLPGYKPIWSYITLGARGYRITTIWANSADDKKKKKKKKIFFFFFFFLLPRKQGLTVMQWRQFAWNANPVFLEEWENVSKCRQLKILPRVLGVMVCTNKSRIDLYMAKPTIKLVRRDGSAHTLWACTSVVWSEPSLIVCTSYNL